MVEVGKEERGGNLGGWRRKWKREGREAFGREKEAVVFFFFFYEGWKYGHIKSTR